MWARKVRKGNSKKWKISQTNVTGWEHNLTVNTDITFTDTVLFSPQLGQTVSNNSEHLGSLQALHPSPWGTSPGTGGTTQLPFLLESCLEQADYHSLPRRDMRPGILSDSFTLIIRTVTVWQEYRCISPVYHKQCQKVNLLKVIVKKVYIYYLSRNFSFTASLWLCRIWQIKVQKNTLHLHVHTQNIGEYMMYYRHTVNIPWQLSIDFSHTSCTESLLVCSKNPTAVSTWHQRFKKKRSTTLCSQSTFAFSISYFLELCLWAKRMVRYLSSLKQDSIIKKTGCWSYNNNQS